jgi:nucleotide-binding universal stress UspA family protein
MFERIVVIVDGSKTAQYAIDASITVAREVGGSITFCITVDPDLFGEGIGVAGLAEMAVMDCRKLLEAATDRARAAGIENVTAHILAEDPVHAVVDTARDTNSNLIMMGLAPKVGILRPFMRSIAEEILRGTKIPLLIMRRPARGYLTRRTLVPLVNNELGRIAIAQAIDIALQFRAALIFCSVEKRTADDEDIREILDYAKSSAEARGIVTQELVLENRNGIPDTIAHLAEITECDSIVMATSLRTGIPRFIEGSVSAAVTYASDVPVILVRRCAAD